MNTRRTTRAAATALVLFTSGVILPVHAWDQERIHHPGSFEAIMNAKMPGVYGPHLPAADIPSTYSAPAPGSWEAIMAIKDPAHYGRHLPAADEPSKASCSLRPGSWEAIMSVKDPHRYGPCGKR